MKEACRQAVLRRSQRLMEAYYLCDLLIDGAEAYGKAHGVLSKRRARILSDEVREGSYMYNVRAYLPAAESFGFAEELFAKTSGACQTQMLFSHWALLEEDPNFVPLTEDEIAEMGDNFQNQPPNLARRYVDAVRKRKVHTSLCAYNTSHIHTSTHNAEHTIDLDSLSCLPHICHFAHISSSLSGTPCQREVGGRRKQTTNAIQEQVSGAADKNKEEVAITTKRGECVCVLSSLCLSLVTVTHTHTLSLSDCT
jgi:hypothetical protein